MVESLSVVSLIRRHDQLSRYFRGLLVTDLVADLEGGPFTVIATADEAFGALRWTFEQLLTDPSCAEPLFDLFEYSIVAGHRLAASDRARSATTLHGSRVSVGSGAVLAGALRTPIIETLIAPNGVVHIVGRCLFPDGIEADY